MQIPFKTSSFRCISWRNIDSLKGEVRIEKVEISDLVCGISHTAQNLSFSMWNFRNPDFLYVKFHMLYVKKTLVTPETTINPLISVHHFSSLSFLIFKLPGSIWNRFKRILLDQEMNLEKKIIKKYWFFHVVKM